MVELVGGVAVVRVNEATGIGGLGRVETRRDGGSTGLVSAELSEGDAAGEAS